MNQNKSRGAAGRTSQNNRRPAAFDPSPTESKHHHHHHRPLRRFRFTQRTDAAIPLSASTSASAFASPRDSSRFGQSSNGNGNGNEPETGERHGYRWFPSPFSQWSWSYTPTRHDTLQKVFCGCGTLLWYSTHVCWGRLENLEALQIQKRYRGK